jgi:aryl-alcohol dehydrogenase-like predicted oxidoreductase
MVLSPGMYGAVDDDESVETVRHALDAGVTLVDTADVYGDGHDERLGGRAVADRRDEVVPATKGGLVPRDGRYGPDGRSEHLREALAATPERLGVDAVDLRYLHSPDPAVPVEESVAATVEFVDEGTGRHLGASNVTPDQLRRAHAAGPVAAVQRGYSPFERGPEAPADDGETLLDAFANSTSASWRTTRSATGS